MADERGVARAGSAFVEESFEAAGGAAEVHVAERGGVGGCVRFRGSYGGLHQKFILRGFYDRAVVRRRKNAEPAVIQTRQLSILCRGIGLISDLPPGDWGGAESIAT